ncbi:hypothetical protein HPB48_000371 [Haemaphysalis longicornis]|uniref:DNA topoisomerase I DNA binding eukaryotic-type domain-containing protein n=1 Tax=Haemaphysalis longicornis TaxID=44386 RepID=A0A9J6GAQ6_HAELO|nr:hypothetical protein HPB48_000371 [Haemaphysalis longicornis]
MEVVGRGKAERRQEVAHPGTQGARVRTRVPASARTMCSFYYDGAPVKLSRKAEEVAGFYGRMLDHDYTSKEAFNKNFFRDWRTCMTAKEKRLLKDLSKCNFEEICAYYKRKSEERKAMTKKREGGNQTPEKETATEVRFLHCRWPQAENCQLQD